MEDDDEFGDLYTDVFCPISTTGGGAAAPSPPPSAKDPFIPSPDVTIAGGNEDRILFGSSSSVPAGERLSVPQQTLAPASEDDAAADGEDDWMLGRAPPAVDPPTSWDDDEEGVSSHPAGSGGPGNSHDGEPRVLEEDYEGEVRLSGISEGEARRAPEEEEDSLVGGGDGALLGDSDQVLVIPGLSVAPAPAGAFLGANVGDAKPAQSEDWDSDSEDDIQIVLNDSNDGPLGGERKDRIGVEDDDDEDGEENLVIVTDEDQNHHLPVMLEQDWGDESMQHAGDGEKKEAGDVPKVMGAAGAIPGARIGYSNHGLYGQHHSMYKYVRPGAAPVSAGPLTGAVGLPGVVRPPSALGPVAGRGRGDWRPVGGRGIPNAQKNYHTGFGSAWPNSSAARPFGSGLDFTLPAHKTVFDIDIESFEEKPWRYPGIDLSDFFNFGLDEEKWKDYCKQLDQLRLESTMQSKIRVYESGRSEQEYDPDLPPELAAAAGHHDMSADNGHAKADNGLVDFNGQGRGSTMRAPLPTGRAIQVENGYGERLPSIDTRPPRIRDSDAIIEIVLQGSMDEPEKYNVALEQPDKDLPEDQNKDFHEVVDERNAEKDYRNHYSYSSSGQGRETTVKVPFPPEADAKSSPSESPGRDHQASRTRSPLCPSGSFGAHHGGRFPQGSSHGRRSRAREHSADTMRSHNTSSSRLDEHQNAKLVDTTELNKSLEMSTAVVDETATGTSIEGHSDEPEEKLALVDEIEREDLNSDVHVSSETRDDDKLVAPGKIQKLSSRVEQPAVNDVGDDNELRASNSDSSKAKSGSSKDYLSQRENGEEVLQRPGRMGDSRKPHDAGEYNYRQKDDYGRDTRHEIDRNRLLSKGRDDSYQQREWDLVSSHPVRGRNFEKAKESEGSARQRRDDYLHSRRVKEEDRRENSDETMSRHRSKLRSGERNQRDEEFHSRKHMEDGDWRGRTREEIPRQRERDGLLMNRRENADDLFMKRKRDEEYLRGKADKEDALHSYRDKEDPSRRKRERDDGIDRRKRDDGTRLKDKAEDQYSSKHKDDSWRHREREDRQRLKQSNENTSAHREREDGAAASKTGRAVDDKPLIGTGRNRDEQRALSSDKEFQEKDRRRLNDQSRRGDRTREDAASQYKGRVDVPSHEKQFSNDERSSRNERPSSYNDRPASASGSQQMYRERHRENIKKGKDTELHEQSSQVLGKRKQEDLNSHRNEKVRGKGPNKRQNSNMSVTFSKNDHHQVRQQLDARRSHDSSRKGEEGPTSDDENQEGSKRGRSKLERWTSHKERDYSVIDNKQVLSASSGALDIEGNNYVDSMQVDGLVKSEINNSAEVDTKDGDAGQPVDKMEDRDSHMDTAAKLKRRSERFKLPMPRDKEMTSNKKVENDVQLSYNEVAPDTEVKPERPARKRRWTGT